MEITEQLIEELFRAVREGKETDVPEDLKRFYEFCSKSYRFHVDESEIEEAMLRRLLRMPLFGHYFVQRYLKYHFIERPDTKDLVRGTQQLVKCLPSDSGVMPGSVQLLRTLVARGKSGRDVSDAVKELERACKDEPMIGMELYPDAQSYIESFEALTGAIALNSLRGKKRYAIKNSEFDGKKWNYRTMPSYHPIFAMLIRELGAYIPQSKPVPYMLCIGKNMESDSVPLLFAWILSHPEIAMLSAAMESGEGDIHFPGIYIGQRIIKNKFLWPHWTSSFRRQTNLYAGLMHPELPPVKEFIRMAGVLAKAYREAPQYFEEFKSTIDRAIRTGLGRPAPDHYEAELYGWQGGCSFPDIVEMARDCPQASGYIWEKVQKTVGELEHALYRQEELELIDKAYAGNLF